MKRVLSLILVVVIMCAAFCGCDGSGTTNANSELLSEVNGDIAVELAFEYGNAFHTNTVLTNVTENSDGTVDVDGHFELNISGEGSQGKVYFSGEYNKVGANSYSKNDFDIDF